MKTESMLVRALARLAVCDESDRDTYTKECRELLDKLEGNNGSSNHTPASKPKFESRYDLEIAITDVIRRIGIPAHIVGYKYVREAIAMVVENSDNINAMIKCLYPGVAEKFDTIPTRVERGIRHAIEVAWDRGDVDVLYEIFSNTVDPNKGKPTNSEFIATVAEYVSNNM